LTLAAQALVDEFVLAKRRIAAGGRTTSTMEGA